MGSFVQGAPPGGSKAPSHIVAFQYPVCAGGAAAPEWTGWGEPEAAGASADAPQAAASSAAEARLRAAFDQRLTQETNRSLESGRERGRLEGREAERQAQAAALALVDQRRIRQAADLVESFAHERDRYLHAVEREVVELALAVAARILRREAQMDPLLLTGAVRVALGQLSSSTQVRLRVPDDELGLWTEAIALLPNLAVKPAVLAGEGMRLGECRIETDLGSVDVGLRAQLGEIERGFFDRAGPKAPARSTSEAGR
jgi:flagellar assembly protein FliH